MWPNIYMGEMKEKLGKDLVINSSQKIKTQFTTFITTFKTSEHQPDNVKRGEESTYKRGLGHWVTINHQMTTDTT